MSNFIKFVEMKTPLIYVELKINNSNPAWIGYGIYSKSKKTIYFNGKVLKKGKGIKGNYFDIENGNEYWISGVKKNGADRHYSDSGKIHIDLFVIDDYLKITKQQTLPRNKFILTELNNVPNKALAINLENETL